LISLILASASPRRRDILARLNLPFVVSPANIPEHTAAGESPILTAQRLALTKAEAARTVGQDFSRPGLRTVTIGADTIVISDGRLVGKPRDRDDARAILMLLRGRSHQVFTALALIDVQTGTAVLRGKTTDVTIRPLSDAEISAYVATDDPLDKAGAYAIQNEAFHPVAAIHGCFSNVVGLPLCALASALRELRIPIDRPWQNADGSCDCFAMGEK
jgi:septum formation protein